MKAIITRTLPVILAGAMGLPLVAGSVPAGRAEDVGMSTERLTRVSDAVDRHIAAGNVGSGGQLRADAENAIRQAIVD